jgi:hypothetical protein
MAQTMIMFRFQISRVLAQGREKYFRKSVFT